MARPRLTTLPPLSFAATRSRSGEPPDERRNAATAHLRTSLRFFERQAGTSSLAKGTSARITFRPGTRSSMRAIAAPCAAADSSFLSTGYWKRNCAVMTRSGLSFCRAATVFSLKRAHSL